MKIPLEPRRLHIPILQIDTNLINARQKLSAVNKLELWAKNDVILINMSSIAYEEAQADGNPLRVKKANQQIFTVSDAASEDDPDFQKVAAALFPDGVKDDNQRNDIKIVCDAIHYQAILVTSDGASRTQPGGILGNRHKLSPFVQILSPDEALAFVEGKIKERDEHNERIVREFGGTLPEWTGQD